MPQTFVALQCAFCHTYQGQIDKKSKKFTCVICSQKQSFRTIFAVSNSGKDIRLTVQQLNELRGAADEVQGDVDAIQLRNKQLEQHEAAFQHRQAKITTHWDEYACQDELEGSDTGEAETGFVTALPDNRQRKRKHRSEDHGRTDDQWGLGHNKSISTARAHTPSVPAHMQSSTQQLSRQQPAALRQRTAYAVATSQSKEVQHTATWQGQATAASFTQAAAQLGKVCHLHMLSPPDMQCIPPRQPLQQLHQQSDAAAASVCVNKSGAVRDATASAALCNVAATAREQQQQQLDSVMRWHGAANCPRNTAGTLTTPAAIGTQQQEALLKGPRALDSSNRVSGADRTQQPPGAQPGWRQQQALDPLPAGQQQNQPVVLPNWRQQQALDQQRAGQQQHLHVRKVRYMDNAQPGRHVQFRHGIQAAKAVGSTAGTAATAGAWAAFVDDPGHGSFEAESDDDAAQFVTDIDAADGHA